MLTPEVDAWLRNKAARDYRGNIGAAALAVLEQAMRVEAYQEAWLDEHPDASAPPPDPWGPVVAEARRKRSHQQGAG